MTRRISLITVIIGAALVVAAPAAWGKGQLQPTPEAMAEDGFDRAVAAKLALDMAEDGFDRAVATAKQSHLSSMLDARERALGAKLDTQQTVSPLDRRERALGVRLEQQTAAMAEDGFDRAVVAAQQITRAPVGDSDRFRVDHSNVPVPVSATSSGREIAWSQLGIGFGLGLVLALGIYVAVRFTRIRPLAH